MTDHTDEELIALAKKCGITGVPNSNPVVMQALLPELRAFASALRQQDLARMARMREALSECLATSQLRHENGYIHHRYGVYDCDDNEVQAFTSFDDAVAYFIENCGENSWTINGWNSRVLAGKSDVKNLFSPPSASSECPICGVNTPHEHNGIDIYNHRKHQQWCQEQNNKDREEILKRVSYIERNYGSRPNYDRLQEALSETADIQEWMDGQRAQWRPIESAPKDGTDILIFIEESGEQFSAWYDNGSWWFAKTNNCGHILRDPTHWMPLPAAPSARSTKGEG